MTTKPPATDTACERYAGFMLGFTLDLMALPLAAPAFTVLRARVVELLEDLELPSDLPKTYPALARNYRAVANNLTWQLTDVSLVMMEFCRLGQLLLPRLAGVGARTREARLVRAEFDQLLVDHHVDASEVERRLRRPVLRETRGAEFIYELISTCYEIPHAGPLPRDQGSSRLLRHHALRGAVPYLLPPALPPPHCALPATIPYAPGRESATNAT